MILINFSVGNINGSPLSNQIRSLRSLFSMNTMRNFNGATPGIDFIEQNDVPGTIPLACFQPLLEGRGQAKLTRFYFNSRTRICEKFIYTGKGGNQVCF